MKKTADERMEQNILEMLDDESRNITERALMAGREILELTRDVEKLENDIKQLSAVKSGTKLQLEEIKNRLKDLLGGKKLETPELTISFRKTTSVSITDADQLPAWMKREKTVTEPNKELIRQALESGHEVSGAKLQTNLSVTVKEGVA